MSANRIFLVCAHHPDIEHALLLAERSDGQAQYSAASAKRADDWYALHQRCGAGADHFKLAFHRPQDWDLPKVATDPIESGVKLGIINAMNGSKS